MKNIEEIVSIIKNIEDKNELSLFFSELFTPKELEDLNLRWELLKMLYDKYPQRKIASALKISLCKITRGAKILKNGDSISYKMLKKIKGD